MLKSRKKQIKMLTVIDHPLGREAEDPSGGVTCPIPWQRGCFDLLSPDDVLLGKDCKTGERQEGSMRKVVIHVEKCTYFTVMWVYTRMTETYIQKSRAEAKENSGFKTCRLRPNCEENKVVFAIYQAIPPKLTNPRATILHNSRSPNSHCTVNSYFRKAEG